MHKSDRIEAGCTVEDEPYKLLERDAEKSILAGPLRSPSGQLPFSTSLKAPVPFTHDAVTVPLMFGPNITGSTSWDVNGLGKAGVGYSSCGSSRISNNGAMSVSTGTYWACIGSSGADCGNNAVVNINAKNSNAVYGSSSVVQPSSTRLLFCIKS